MTVKKEKPEQPPPIAKVRMTILLPVDLLDKARDACFYEPGLTMSDLVAKGLKSEISKLEKRRGEPFPPRAGPIKTGRPFKT